MNTKKGNMFFIILTLRCINEDNKVIKVKENLGMVSVKNEACTTDYLTKHAESKNFQNFIWTFVNKYYEPSEISIEFIKPKTLPSGIMTCGNRAFFKIIYKI